MSNKYYQKLKSTIFYKPKSLQVGKYILYFLAIFLIGYHLLDYIGYTTPEIASVIALILDLLIFKVNFDKHPADLKIVDFKISGENYWSTLRTVEFKIYNSGKSTAIVDEIQVNILDSKPYNKFKLWKVGALLNEIKYNVNLDSFRKNKVINDAPLKYNPEETDHISVQFKSANNHLCSLQICILWHDLSKPNLQQEMKSNSFNLGFPISNPIKGKHVVNNLIEKNAVLDIPDKLRNVFEKQLPNILVFENTNFLFLEKGTYLYNLAVFYVYLGKYPEALENFTKAEKEKSMFFEQENSNHEKNDDSSKSYTKVSFLKQYQLYLDTYANAIKTVYTAKEKYED